MSFCVFLLYLRETDIIMTKLERLIGHYFDFSEYGIKECFDIYALNGYDFKENLDLSGNEGVYIFTRRDICSSHVPSYRKEMYYHTLLYCGMTKDLKGRFDEHQYKNELLDEHVSHISIYECSTRKDAKELESKILGTLKFPLNKKENSNPKYPNVKKVLEAF